ncbi:hypothetical protein [Vitiosangium sp. GDMCC 1.1324]|uniref:hypothetical protein n=1 Tax=Vitiosangium sp. (strain GDMCC 1.1324) TaxID=2138576 RepID=UPI000D35366D|nr:hypothetical protein [Vitiosangium sp. GDMCC 1.1324]PTL81797.1 hypothetical protein DAT35_22935 [Vitiosangium sp. GDMCC 1.1324]
MSVTRAADAALKAAVQTHKGLTAQEQALFAGLSGDDLTRAKAQLMLQKQQETVAFISKVLKNDSEMQVINNMR